MSEIKVDWAKIDGLLPVIVQGLDKEVLMLAYMNEEALRLSLETKFAHYFSRSKNRIWKKGEESGNIQIIKDMYLDCDNDTLLIIVDQVGGCACHTGSKSCFYKKIELETSDIKEQKIDIKTNSYNFSDELYHTILDRKLNGDPKISYVAKLFNKGENYFLKKICEEASELAFACKDLSKAQKYFKFNLEKFGEHSDDPKYDVIYECADLIFHIYVALANYNIHPEQIYAELQKRSAISGIEEKNSRSNK